MEQNVRQQVAQLRWKWQMRTNILKTFTKHATSDAIQHSKSLQISDESIVMTRLDRVSLRGVPQQPPDSNRI